MGEFTGMTAIVAELTDHGLTDMLQSLGVYASAARNAREALAQLSDLGAHYLLADALLPGTDGVALLRQAGEMRHLRVRPGRILTCVSGFPTPSDFRVLARPYGAEALKAALRAELPENRPCPAEEAERIHDLLNRLGIPSHRGRAYLTDAIAATLNDATLAGQLSRRLYPALSLRHGATAAQVERAIRHCIDVAWKRGSVDEQYRLFGNTIDAQRGKPTVGEMLARTADILRLEES